MASKSRPNSLSSVGGDPVVISDAPLVEKKSVEVDGVKVTQTTTVESKMDIGATAREWLANGIFYFFLFTWIFVVVIFYFLAVNDVSWYNNLNMYDWMKNSVAFYVVQLVTSLIATVGVYIGYMRAPNWPHQGIIIGVYLVGLVTLFFWFTTFYNNHDTRIGFYLSVTVLLIQVFQTISVWTADAKAGYCMLPYLVWLFLACWGTYYIMVSNPVPNA